MKLYVFLFVATCGLTTDASLLFFVVDSMMTGYDVNLAEDSMCEFYVVFKGPAGSTIGFSVFRSRG
jgi:hypothetical protein